MHVPFGAKEKVTATGHVPENENTKLLVERPEEKEVIELAGVEEAHESKTSGASKLDFENRKTAQRNYYSRPG